jgi:hypothetical protein
MRLKILSLVLSLLTFRDIMAADNAFSASLPAYFQDEYGSDSSQRIHFSGEAGAGFFDTGDEGMYPNSEFRLDEAKLFVEAQIISDVYVFGELNLMTREEGDDNVSIGEMYIEFENLSKLWNQENALNARAGRMDLPFGEEYQTRDVIDNPLITHSLSDIWGVDEGVEVYGTIGRLEYTFAVQNGSDPATRDFNSDKAVIGRILYRPVSKFHASFSAMRSGKIDVEQDQYTAIWFGNSLFHLLAPEYSSPIFRVNGLEGDGHFQWNRGYVHAAGGRFEYNDETSGNQRKMYYYQIEAQEDLSQRRGNVWYVAGRFSRIDADPEFPIIGNGSYQNYYNYGNESKFLWRLSLGSGYRIRRNYLLKAEYSFERGKQVDGTKRNHEDFFSIVVAAKF